MKLYRWDVTCFVTESGTEPHLETVQVNAIDNERVAKAAAVLKIETWPRKARAVARTAARGEFVKEFEG